MCMGAFVCVYDCALCACTAQTGQKGAMDPLELELQASKSCLVNAVT